MLAVEPVEPVEFAGHLRARLGDALRHAGTCSTLPKVYRSTGEVR
jgi:hypothetical protein